MANETVKTVPPLVAKAVMDGKTVKYGEWRNGAASSFVGGKEKKTFKVFKSTIETENAGTFSNTEFLPNEVDVNTYVSPYKKGEMVFAVVDGCETVSGVALVTGKLLKATV